jgi:hypothetical protein
LKPATTVYAGMRDPDEPNSSGESVVTVDDQTLPLSPSLKLMNHSPTGFSWGYGGSGPAQLALAILYDYFADQHKALRLYQSFKWKSVALWAQGESWKITGAEIDAICSEIEARR